MQRTLSLSGTDFLSLLLLLLCQFTHERPIWNHPTRCLAQMFAATFIAYLQFQANSVHCSHLNAIEFHTIEEFSRDIYIWAIIIRVVCAQMRFHAIP